MSHDASPALPTVLDEGIAARLKRDERGLVCAVVQQWDSREVLMVGNNTLEDGIATKLGCDLFLIEDFLIERKGGVRLDDVKHGSSADFLAFCERLGEAKRS